MIIDINQQQLRTVSKLVEGAGLPVRDFGEVHWFNLIGWCEKETIAGVAGLQQCGNSLLLRSVAIEPSCRGRGLAYVLVNTLHQRGIAAGVSKTYLLTLEAADYFQKKFDYQSVNRIQAPREIAQSEQFLHLCPQSAILMEKCLV